MMINKIQIALYNAEICRVIYTTIPTPLWPDMGMAISCCESYLDWWHALTALSFRTEPKEVQLIRCWCFRAICSSCIARSQLSLQA